MGTMANFHRYFREIETLSFNTDEECKQNLSISKQTFSIIHLNVRSLDKHFGELEVLMEHHNYIFDIIVCTETWNLKSPELYSLTGYTTIYNSGNINQNDGTIVFVRSGFSCSHTVVMIGEVKAIKLCIQVKKQNILVTALYRPHTVDLDLFITELDVYLSECKGGGGRVYW